MADGGGRVAVLELGCGGGGEGGTARAEGEAFVAALNAGGRARATLIRCHPTAPEADGEAVGGALLSLMVEVSEGVRLLDEALG